MPPRLRKLAPLLALLCLVPTACGQLGEARAHKPPSRSSPLVAVHRPGPSPSLNGENNGPNPALRYVVFHRRKVMVIRKGKNPLQVCPVHGRGFFSRDFGAPRFAGGFHLHQGTDMFAAGGTPIVAPFPGEAVATPNELGGLAVTVFGAPGSVYNAHLSAYGKLGAVRTGDVIGFVGNTGDAQGGPPHDHFEFHPGNRPAVDPYPYLVTACSAKSR